MGTAVRTALITAQGHQFKEDEMGRAFGTYREAAKQDFCCRNLKERDQLDDLDIDGRATVN